MSFEFDTEINRLLHLVTFTLNEFSTAEKDFYKAKKIFHDRNKSITIKLELAKQEIFELIRIKNKDDEND